MENVEKPAQEIEKQGLSDLERKERKVVELRQMGITFDVIAEQVGYASASGAFHAYERYMERFKREPSDQARELQRGRLDRLLAGVWTKALRGEIPAIMASLKILERMAKLDGLDAPVKSESAVTVFDGGSDLDEQVRRFAYLVAQARTNNEIGYSDGGAVIVGESSARESDTTDDGLAELVDLVGSGMGQDEMRVGMDSMGSVIETQNPMGGSSEDSR